MSRYSSFTISVFIIAVAVLAYWIFFPAIQLHNASKLEHINEEYISSTANETLPLINEDYDIDISVVIPVFNEEERLPGMLKDTISFFKLWRTLQQKTFEILVVDDGSIDGTCDLVKRYMNEFNPDQDFLRLLKLGKNYGKGGAVKRGVLNSRGKYILMVDGDGATNIADFEKLYESSLKLEEKKLDASNELLMNLIKEGDKHYTPVVSVGSRAHLQGKSIATREFHRTVLMFGFHVLVTLLCSNKISDTQCGFKLFNRDAARLIFPSMHIEGWAFDIELINIAEKYKIPISEVPVEWHEVPGSKLIKNKLDVVFTSLSMARDMLCIRLCYLLGIWRTRL